MSDYIDALFAYIREKFYSFLIFAFIFGNLLWVFFVNLIAFATPLDVNDVEYYLRPWGFTTWQVIERRYWTPQPEGPLFDGTDIFSDLLF